VAEILPWLQKTIADSAPESEYNRNRFTGRMMDWHEFPEGEEPRVLTGISSLFDEGKHAECPVTQKSERHGGQTVFCDCRRHKVPSEA
jgi:hypothetical protein